MSTKLTDFTVEELQHALDEVVAGILRLEGFKEVQWFIKGDGGHCTIVEHKTITRYQNLCLWRTQILNAMHFVKRHEQINSN